MILDKEKIRFKGKLISAALRLNASVSDAGARDFVDQIYEEWRATGLPLEESTDWLGSRLAEVFVSYNAPPVWVEDEPAWPFHQGKAMIFLCQITMDDGPFSASALSPGETIYVFAARQPVDRGFKMIYRVVSQFV